MKKLILSFLIVLMIIATACVTVSAAFTVGDNEFTLASYNGVNTFVGAGKNINALEDSTYWVLDSKEAYNVKFVGFLGRIADAPPYSIGSVGQDSSLLEQMCFAHQPWHDQYQAFTRAVAPLTDDDMPIGISFALEDYLPSGWKRTNLVSQYLPTDSYMLDGEYECDYLDELNSYTVVENNGTEYIIFSLELWPRASVLDWFVETVKENLDKYVIIYTNSFTDTDGKMYTMWDWANGFKLEGTTNLKSYNIANSGKPRDGEGVWNYALKQFDNILAVISSYTKGIATSNIITGKAINDNGIETALVCANADYGANNNGVTLLLTKFSEDNTELTCTWATAYKGIDESSTVTIKLDKIATLQKKDTNDTLPKIPLQQNGSNTAYIFGYDGNVFRPNSNMTRAEACTIFARLLLGTQTIPDGYNSRFQDVKTGDWFYNAIAYLDETGFFYRLENNTYAPNEPITRAEFVELANLASSLSGTAAVSFTDVPEGHFYYESILAAASSGLVNGYEDNTFRPDKTITRAEVVTVINRLLGLKATDRTVDTTRLENEFVDISSHWARLNVLMASNSSVHGSYYYSASLDGITDNAADITFANKLFSFTVSKKNGKVTEIINLENGESILSAPSTPYFVYLTNEKGSVVAPTRFETEGNRLKVTFKDKNVVYLIAEVKDDYMTFEIDSELPKSIKKVTFGNLAIFSSVAKNGFLLNSMAMTAWTQIANTGYRDSCYTSIAHAHTIYDTGIMGAKVGIVMSNKADAIPILQQITDAIDPKYGLTSKAGGAYAQEWEGLAGDYVILQDTNPENLDELIALAKKLGIDQLDIHQGANNFIQGDFRFVHTESGTAAEFYEKIGKKIEDAGLITGLHTYAYYISADSTEILSNPKWQKQIKLMPDEYTLRKNLSATNRNIATNEDASKIDVNATFFNKTSRYILIDEEIIRVGSGTTSGLINCTRGACGTTATTHKKDAKIYHLEGYFGMITPILGSELFYHIADLTAKAYNEGGFNMIYIDAIDGLGKHIPEGHETWYYHCMFIHRILSQCERTPIIETSNGGPNDWNFRGRSGAWDHANYAHKKHIANHVEANKSAINGNQQTTLGWFNFMPDREPELDLKNTFEKTLFRDEIDFLGLQALIYNSSIVYEQFTSEKLNSNPFLMANIEYYNEYYSKLRKSKYFSDEVLNQVKSIGGEWRVVEKDGKYALQRRVYEYANLGDITDVESTLDGTNIFLEQTPFIRIESRYSSLLDKPYTLLEFDETKEVGASNIVKTFSSVSMNSAGAVMTVKVKGTAKDGDAMLISISSGNGENVDGRRDHFIDLNYEGWREFIFIDSDNAQYDISKYQFSGVTTTGATYSTYRFIPTLSAINRVTIRMTGDTGKNAMMDDIILQPYNAAPIKNPTIKVGGQSITFNCEMSGGEYLEYDPEARKAILYHNATQTTEEVTYTGSITVKGDYSASLSAESLTAAPLRARLTFGFSGQELGN